VILTVQISGHQFLPDHAARLSGHKSIIVLMHLFQLKTQFSRFTP
jgi:hypothetical protein